MAALKMLLFCILMSWVRMFAEQECTSDRSSKMKFSLVSRRNKTGHWIYQAELQHEAGRRNLGPWILDVDHSVSKCGDNENVLIMASIAAAPRRSIPLSRNELFSYLEYYKFHTTPKVWDDAVSTCAQEGGHLLVLNSQSEYEVVKTILDRHPTVLGDWRNPYSFVGVSSLPSKEFFTIFNEPLNATGYTDWASGQPNYDGNCVLLERNGKLHDTRCTIAFPFICEKEY